MNGLRNTGWTDEARAAALAVRRAKAAARQGVPAGYRAPSSSVAKGGGGGAKSSPAYDPRYGWLVTRDGFEEYSPVKAYAGGVLSVRGVAQAGDDVFAFTGGEWRRIGSAKVLAVGADGSLTLRPEFGLNMSLGGAAELFAAGSGLTPSPDGGFWYRTGNGMLSLEDGHNFDSGKPRPARPDISDWVANRGWTDAARAASLAVRRARALSRTTSSGFTSSGGGAPSGGASQKSSGSARVKKASAAPSSGVLTGDIRVDSSLTLLAGTTVAQAKRALELHGKGGLLDELIRYDQAVRASALEKSRVKAERAETGYSASTPDGRVPESVYRKGLEAWAKTHGGVTEGAPSSEVRRLGREWVRDFEKANPAGVAGMKAMRARWTDYTTALKGAGGDSPKMVSALRDYLKGRYADGGGMDIADVQAVRLWAGSDRTLTPDERRRVGEACDDLAWPNRLFRGDNVPRLLSGFEGGTVAVYRDTRSESEDRRALQALLGIVEDGSGGTWAGWPADDQYRTHHPRERTSAAAAWAKKFFSGKLANASAGRQSAGRRISGRIPGAGFEGGGVMNRCVAVDVMGNKWPKVPGAAGAVTAAVGGSGAAGTREVPPHIEMPLGATVVKDGALYLKTRFGLARLGSSDVVSADAQGDILIKTKRGTIRMPAKSLALSATKNKAGDYEVRKNGWIVSLENGSITMDAAWVGPRGLGGGRARGYRKPLPVGTLFR